MTTAVGIGAWHNNYNTLPLAKCVERAQRAKLEFVIVKYGMPETEKAYAAGGIRWATERYVYANDPAGEGNKLADAVLAGAQFAVINAEEGPGGWGPAAETGPAMYSLISTFRGRQPTVPLYASIDTRGDRLTHPYQQVMLQNCTGIMPMVYPKGFRETCPPDFVAIAFRDCLDDKNFAGLPILPTIQTYDGIGPDALMEQALECFHRGLSGFQAYTIHHATDAEWDAVCRIVAAWSNPVQGPVDEAKLRETYMNLARELLAFRPDSLQRVVDSAAVYLGTRAKV